MEEELSSCRKTLETIKSTYEQRLSVLQKEKLQTEQQLTEVTTNLMQTASQPSPGGDETVSGAWF